jgi:hypothetical protein
VEVPVVMMGYSQECSCMTCLVLKAEDPSPWAPVVGCGFVLFRYQEDLRELDPE